MMTYKQEMISNKSKSAVVNHAAVDVVQNKSNKTGLPDPLKSGIENISGIDISDTKVHYNSTKPAALQAHAFTQGSNIYVGPNQEKHLAHEAWHVVQQKQGIVKPTTEINGKHVNDNPVLEKQADVMGAKAQSIGASKRNE